MLAAALLLRCMAWAPRSPHSVPAHAAWQGRAPGAGTLRNRAHDRAQQGRAHCATGRATGRARGGHTAQQGYRPTSSRRTCARPRLLPSAARGGSRTGPAACMAVLDGVLNPQQQGRCGDGVCDMASELGSPNNAGCPADCSGNTSSTNRTLLQLDMSWEFARPAGSLSTCVSGQASESPVVTPSARGGPRPGTACPCAGRQP